MGAEGWAWLQEIGWVCPYRAARPDLPLAAASMGEVVLVGVEEAEAVVAIEEGVAGAMEASEAGDEVEMAGGGAVPFGLTAGCGVGSGLLFGCCCCGC